MQPQQAFDGFDVAIDNRAKLEAKFIIPPFSVLDTRQGYWQERKRLWLGLGIQSELGRGETCLYDSEAMLSQNAEPGHVGAPDYYRHKHKQKNNPNAAPDHSLRPAMDCSKKERGDGRGRPIPKIDGLTFRSTGFAAEVMAERGGGTSIFDPVLCELVYKWFCPEGGEVFDPFAGGSVRGIVASILGRKYTGMDLSLAQIEANQEQAEDITPDNKPEWIIGDSWALNQMLPQGKHYDLIFSCPPYHDLEKYTDAPEDLSNMSWDTFKGKYKTIIENCILRLNNNRFAVFVVSEIRDKIGAYKGLVPFTIQSFVQGGARYYNEMILVNVAGSLPIRIAGQFGGYRKIGRMHQNVLVFYKGDPEQIPRNFKDIDTSFNFGGNGDASL